jgi:voltage-gated potassium channel
MADQPQPTDRQRWRTLRQLDEWVQTPMVVLALVWLAIVLIELISGSSKLLETVGTVIWVIFIAEFAVRLLIAPKKLAFLKHNWLTAIALVVPALRVLRLGAIFRAARALRSLRLIRIVGTANRSMNALRRTLARRGFGYVAAFTLLVLLLGAAGMLNFEPASEVPGGFTSYGDALWWTAMLLTSIGSQFWPSTTEGRVLTVLLSLYGFATFGYITATFASFFVGRDAEEKNGPVAGSKEVEALAREIRELRAELEQRRRDQ